MEHIYLKNEFIKAVNSKKKILREILPIDRSDLIKAAPILQMNSKYL